MKWLILFIIGLCIPMVSALDACGSKVSINESCNVITPSTTCAIYSYNIYNSTGSNVGNGAITPFAGSSLYYFTFQEDIEDVYTVQICDGSIFKIDVNNGVDDMLLGLLIFLPLAIAFGLMYWGNQLDKDHWFLKLLFQMLFLPLALLSLHFGVLGIAKLYPSDVDIVNLLSDVAYYIGLLFWIVGAYVMIYIVWMFVKLSMNIKTTQEKQKYGEEKEDGD